MIISVPAYLWLYDSNGVLIQGGSEILGREGAIEIQSFTHGLSVPFDGNTGRLMSTRVHQTMGLVKEFDKSTPYLYRAVATSEKLQKAVVKWYRINAAGMEDEYLNMTMEGVRLLNINPHMHNFKHAEGQASIPTESIGLGIIKSPGCTSMDISVLPMNGIPACTHNREHRDDFVQSGFQSSL